MKFRNDCVACMNYKTKLKTFVFQIKVMIGKLFSLWYHNVSFSTPKDNNTDAASLYSLTWTLQFPYDSDTCYLAHCYPYTYSQLQRYLRNISSNPAVVSYCTVRVLCHSLAGNAVYVLTITSRGMSRPQCRTKKVVVVTARVHPGETNGSWMMEGFLDFLLGDSEDAQLLRDTFVFKVMELNLEQQTSGTVVLRVL